MPTYEFRCPSGHSFERFYRKMADAVTELECPVCGKVATRQLSGGAGLVFKGSGFYLTDYGRNAHRGGGPAADKSGLSESKSEGGGDSAARQLGDSAGEAKGESKSESKGDAAKAAGTSGGESKGGERGGEKGGGKGESKGGEKGSSKSDSSTSSKPSGPKD